MPRQVSDDMISVGLKCFRAKLDFPEPVAPISTTKANSGIFIFLSLDISSFYFNSSAAILKQVIHEVFWFK
jgi:hypothetical protein